MVRLKHLGINDRILMTPAEAAYFSSGALDDVIGAFALVDHLVANLLHWLLLADQGEQGAGGDGCSNAEGRKPFGPLLN